ncbi:MAG: hypothetical protein NE328_11090 [Lentisphaeraceae bacterium]|nr:hypothetical protein [Lentisphaeraceae bacterium]
MINALWKKAVFLAGDIRRLNTFPWVTWSINNHKVCLGEVLEALPLIKYGDIGLHRDWGYLSNVAIPGFMKHGWIHVSSGDKKPMVVEAISEGVVHRSALYPMYSDYTIILEPKDVIDEERKGACKKAKSIVGEKYDVNFHFDIEDEIAHYNGLLKDEAITSLEEGEKRLKKFDPAFSCTEVCSYAWWHKREHLRLFRKPRRGKNVILADDFLNNSWRIKWMSKSVTVEDAVKYGLHEEGVSMIENFISGRASS